MSISNFGENAILDAIFNNTALQEASRFVKLHIGDPGEAGTANAAAETTRKSVTGAAASGGTFTTRAQPSTGSAGSKPPDSCPARSRPG